MESAQKIALTAYGPFARGHNSSMEVGERVVSLLEADGVQVEFRVMETSWTSFAHDLDALVAEAEPDVLISLGERPDVDAPVVEMNAKNERRKADVNGTFGAGAVVEGGPRERCVSEEFRRAQEAASQGGADIGFSFDAGTYLCNAALYVNLGMQEAGRVRHGGFVHVPSRERRDPLIENDARAVAEFIRRLG